MKTLTKPNVTVKSRHITAVIAAQMLEKNHSNRKLNPQIVARYARIMSNGRWINNNGETIKIDNEGGLIDGQHRLSACVLSGVAFDTFVVEGVETSVFDTIDTGKGRTGADALYASGVTSNSTLVASIANLAIKLETESLRTNRYIEPHTVRQWVIDHPEVNEAAEMVVKLKFLGFGPVLGLTYLIAHKIDAEKAKEFFDQLLTGENLSKGDPALTLRETLIKHKSDRGYHKADVLAMALTAWKSYQMVKQLPVLKRNMKLVEAFAA